ncbi:MAG: [protein-PII] uridylyltransferase [Desulfobacter postgatei]|uniref:Bifunctional uridylyltransferase/uridylyl-removing enzyme n=1 Tax=Desulfobacter postgatei TaxID=2293 RepID=A0A2G6MS11_9BACT|nr:MAG: [protein-PII] uridylyltransferase [Desulfobacter postgatei]
MDSPEAKLLIEQKQALTDQYLQGQETNFLEKMTTHLDGYFHRVFEKSIAAQKMDSSGNPFALIALGGYGRKEQCIHSDIDLLILFENLIAPDVEAFVQELLYPLWDARFEVGYAIRNINECITMSFERFDILTTVLDARFICGACRIYSGFMEKFRQQLSATHLKPTLNYLYENGEKRLADFGDSSFLVSPDLKSGFGGLRDYHTLLWYAKIKSNIKARRDLEYYGFLSHFEYKNLEDTLTYIWDVRNRLHYICQRKNDTLHFEHQPEVAGLMDYTDTAGRPQVEVFLGELHEKMDFLKQIYQITFEDILFTWPTRKETVNPRPTKINGLIVRKHRLCFVNTVTIIQHPDLLLRIFLESGQTRIPLSIEARRIAWEFRHLVDDKVRTDPGCIKIFNQILGLSLETFHVLNVMLSTGILARFIPEFSPLVHKIQYNQYHLFPVDKHSIRCVQILNSFRDPGDRSIDTLYNSVFKEIRNKNVLLVAGLLHDIGKSDPAREHSRRGARIAGPVVDRLGFSPGEKQDILFLIENHLFLAKTATRRDIYDEETAVYTAHKIGKIRLLRMLFLLTVADSQATGPKAWNQWTENLIKDLFFKTMRIINTGELASRKTQRLIDNKKKEVLDLLRENRREEEVTRQLSAMSRRYLLYVPAQNIVDHMNLFRNLEDREYIWQITKDNDPDMRTVSICGKDKPGVYSKLAGVFFQNNIDIISSQAYSLGTSHFLDIFHVRPPQDRLFEEEKWEKAGQDLSMALEDDHYLDNVLEKIPTSVTISSGSRPEDNQVRIDNETSSFFTIIEVLTYDFPGLLFAITNTLYRAAINVNVAMVATKIDQVMDVFYIRDIEVDQKIESEERLNQIKRAILKRLPQIQSKESINEKN